MVVDPRGELPSRLPATSSPCQVLLPTTPQQKPVQLSSSAALPNLALFCTKDDIWLAPGLLFALFLMQNLDREESTIH